MSNLHLFYSDICNNIRFRKIIVSKVIITMNKTIALLACIVIVITSCTDKKTEAGIETAKTTLANPMNLSYSFRLDTPSRREAADPTMVVYKGEYYLFASKSGGYFHSTDLVNWDLITTNDLPLEDYAPTAVVMNDTLYFMSSNRRLLLFSKLLIPNQENGRWLMLIFLLE